jgi:hypothetical protein
MQSLKIEITGHGHVGMAHTYTWVLSLAFGLCTLTCFWTCSHVVSCPCSSFGRRRRREKKKTRSRRNFFSLLHAIVVKLVDAECFVVLSSSQLPSTIRSPSVKFCPSNFVCPLTSVYLLPFIPIDTLYVSNRMYIRIQYRIFQIVSSVLYWYKILGHGTTPCLWMMRTLLLSQSQGISYEVAQYHLSWFLWIQNLHDGTIKRLQCHCHPVQLLLGIQVQVTLHQQYIIVHLEGLISGVRLLSH